MGELKVKRFERHADKANYISQLLKEIEILEFLIKEKRFERKPIRIGAEQEFCVTQNNWEPNNNAGDILEEVNDPHFTHELTRYNLEINLDPLVLKGSCFSELHWQLDLLLDKVSQVADKHDSKIVLTGILPTIGSDHLEKDYMTPAKRYDLLNKSIKEIRQKDIELHIKGVDEINLYHDSILYEGCNTSFQAHLQIDPEDFISAYNWAQAISGPVLSICTNSPLLMGKELWEETRIALFTQSIDTRPSSFVLNERESRVSFGNQWVKGTIADFLKDEIIGYRSLITGDFNDLSWEEIKGGMTPKLKALGLLNGTIYKWNRPCYGITDGLPHLRIENRYIPAGPTTEDEIANMMFWVGIMQGRPAEWDNVHERMDFKDVKGNFFNAARYGMASQFYWDGKLCSSRDLILDTLLPMAYKGLYKMDLEPKDVERYLSVIERRAKTRGGSRWITEAYRSLRKKANRPEALRILVAAMHERQNKKYAVDAWELPRGDEFATKDEARKVKDIMNTRVITVLENDSLELVLKTMQWKDIHHMPVLNKKQELSGLLSWKDMEQYLDEPEILRGRIDALMQRDLITIDKSASHAEAKDLMQSNNINCLPVLQGKRLVGIITSNDL
ncbi:CBS domain-containing protein [Poritiphilus flavus]|uniref:CBS domain-containing protein n=1 Tax=Poritiphilus flavus TaxID=2697053 RepID=A0A6L9E8S0_9FLAO|nr:CBS domain-containing protein [Poritiphilus flavus]NAS11034.1 CBS domain-containing protein [Poritiphilus flavus]